MSVLEQVLIPDIGDVDEVEVVEILVEVGTEVEAEEALITLESDKASMDVPSPMAGKVTEVAIAVGDKVAAGTAILTLEVDESAREAAKPAVPAPAAATPAPAASPTRPAPPPPVAKAGKLPPIDESTFSSAHASPSVRRFARELGVSLGQVTGSGRKGRVVKEDVQAFVRNALAGGSAAGLSAGSLPGIDIPAMPEIDFSRFGDIERQKLSRIQRIAGPSLHRSWLHVPRVTQHDESDITEMEALRREHSPRAKEQGFSLTPLAFVMKASVAALKEFPVVNSSLDVEASELVLKKYYHFGIAVDTPGGLIVPVVRDVDKKSIFELAQELRETSVAAREGKLKLDQLQGASFTITSLGGIGGTAFTPVVSAPEVGILGVSRSYMKPVWKADGEGGGEFVPRLMLPLSFSYDHRAVDGATAVRFTTFLAARLSEVEGLDL